MQVETRIREKLNQAFAPIQLMIENESHKHAHHAAMKGAANTGETHFKVSVVSDSFAGQSRVQRHRMVNEVLAEELAGSVHALSVSAQTPEEAGDGG
jgi:BolA protein